jgi:hypothetical protein
MLRIDLEAAGIAYAVEGPDGPLYADFHALRHSYLTLGGRSGIDLRTLQELAGHSTPVLTARYSHRRLHDLAAAVEKLPPLLPTEAPAATLRATGTEGADPGELRTPAVLSLRQACATAEAGRGLVRGGETPAAGEGQKAARPQPPVSAGVEAGCDSLRSVDCRAGDRIRTGDVQLGKLLPKCRRRFSNSRQKYHLRQFTAITPAVQAFSKHCKNPRENEESSRDWGTMGKRPQAGVGPFCGACEGPPAGPGHLGRALASGGPWAAPGGFAGPPGGPGDRRVRTRVG